MSTPPPTDQPDTEAEEATPWRPEHGPKPTVAVWPHGYEPALWVYTAGKWRSAIVRARLTHADGRVAYRVNLNLPTGPGEAEGSHARVYWWGGPGVRFAREGTADPS